MFLGYGGKKNECTESLPSTALEISSTTILISCIVVGNETKFLVCMFVKDSSLYMRLFIVHLYSGSGILVTMAVFAI